MLNYINIELQWITSRIDAQYLYIIGRLYIKDNSMQSEK